VCWLGSQGYYVNKNGQDPEPSQPTRIYKRPSTFDTALPTALDCCHMSSVKRELLISNGHLNVNTLVQEASGVLGATHRMLLSQTRCYSESSKAARRCIRWVWRYAIGCASASDALCPKPSLVSCDPADVSAHWTLNRVSAASGARAPIPLIMSYI